MGKRNHLKTIRSLQKCIDEHQEKIRLEKLRELPNLGLIRHWEKEIRAFEKGIQQAKKRLGR
ncbi:hypothetical protein [Nodosilinea sp. P-1105]|uniref:hypothetical protein n=1 Tax=Nodosilinea sp. P-1105 TaxID=2546229 RepID=UPI00146B9780|nr:hypothetical protein [Nodosilinea sp. P-1105]NMF84737.1 hypothetical protein [Nodosilinea sp. P-1105]